MINVSSYIFEVASKYTDICDPYELADRLNIHVEEIDFKKQKGVFFKIDDEKFIFLNKNLLFHEKMIVFLHEIGHAVLHSEYSQVFMDMNLYDSDCYEYEANLFAAHILLPDERIIPLIYEGRTREEIACITGTNEDLVAIKAFDLSKRGHCIDSGEYNINFLKTSH